MDSFNGKVNVTWSILLWLGYSNHSVMIIPYPGSLVWLWYASKLVLIIIIADFIVVSLLDDFWHCDQDILRLFQIAHKLIKLDL